MLAGSRHGHAGMLRPRPDAKAAADAIAVADGADAAGGLRLALAPERISESLRARERIAVDADATAQARALLNRVADTVEPTTRFQIDLVLTDLICQRTLDVATAEDRDFHLEISRAPGHVHVELVDEGRPQPRGRMVPSQSASEELQLVAELADRWGMSYDGATTIWFEFALGAGA